MKNLKSEYKVAVFGAFIGIVLTAVYDYFKERPVLTTLWNSIKWIWKNLFGIKISLWQLILVLTIFYFLFRLKPKKKEKLPDFLTYKTDKFDDVEWRWDWKWNSVSSKWHINNLVPLCNNCRTATKLYEEYLETYSTCPRCKNYMARLKPTEDIRAIIVDNINRNWY